jgi:dephospho-CoA kinase
MKPILGLIGAIGAGKSTVANHLAKRGGFVVDADKLGHLVLEEAAVKTALVARWGDKILSPDGSMNRKAIGAIVFQNPAERHALEAIVFPRIHEREQDLFASVQNRDEVRFIVLDAAVLLEAGHGSICWKLLFVDAPRALREARVHARSGWSAEELTRREASQMPLDEKRKLADAVVHNDGAVETLAQDLDDILRSWGLVPVGHTARSTEGTP